MTSIRKGTLVIRTQCGHCPSISRTASAAVKHVRKHRALLPKQGGLTPENGTLPAIREHTMSNHAPDDFFACSPSCVDRGADWSRTPCLCQCHYFGPTSRQMSKVVEGSRIELEPAGATIPSAAINTSPRRVSRVGRSH